MSHRTLHTCDGCGQPIVEGTENYLTGAQLIGVDGTAKQTDIDIHGRQDCLLAWLKMATPLLK